MILTVFSRRKSQLEMYFFVGQIMGVAVRTRNLLSLDLPSIVWKQLAGKNQIDMHTKKQCGMHTHTD